MSVRILWISIALFTISASGCRSSGEPSGGGGLVLLLLIGGVIWAFSSIGQYTAGFSAGRRGNPKNLEHRCLSDNLKDAYDEGYRDGQLSNIRRDK